MRKIDHSAELAELARLNELARGMAALSTGATRRHFTAQARRFHRMACALSPVPPAIAAMPDDALAAELLA